jgi:hypothetical protein
MKTSHQKRWVVSMSGSGKNYRELGLYASIEESVKGKTNPL